MTPAESGSAPRARIVVLDGHTLNPGDLDWGPLAALGDLTVHDRTPPAALLARAAGAQVLLTNKTILSREAIEALPDLRYIGVLATGYNIVDIDAARIRRIVVTNVPDYASRSVSQMVFGHILNLTLHVAHHAEAVRAGRWSACPDFCFWERPLIELAGLTLGIVGLGRIGRAVAEIAIAFGMRILACDVAPPPRPPAGVEMPRVEMTDLETLFRESDVVTLHCPLTPETRHLVDRRRLASMKPTAFLINTGRGPLVDEQALAEALAEGRLAGAGLDVLSVEPPPPDNPLLAAPRVAITPHIAWATRAARARLLRTVVENLEAFFAGRPKNVVNL